MTMPDATELSSPVAALYDVHGNLPALDAVLAEVESAGATEIVSGGDVALGPLPRETVDRLIALGPRVRCVRGNCDRYVVEAWDGDALERLAPAMRERVAWTARQLDRRHRDFLAAFAPTVATRVAGVGDVLFCHATPRSDEEIFTVRTPAERVRALLGEVGDAVVVCGHTHMPFDRRVDDVRVVNAGSVGMPFGAPGAHWLLVGPTVRHVRTEYDRAGAAALIRETSFPQAADFASRNVLQPPSEEEMLAVFERPPQR
jgi:putative phosphoesterase